MKSVTSTTPLVCTVTTGVVAYVAVGTCTLVAHVAAGTNYLAADGSPQNITIGAATPTPTISNLPASGIFGVSFTPTVSTSSDGVKSVTSTTPLVCTVTAGVVAYVGVGTCILVAIVGTGTNYTAGTGTNQSVSIAQAASSGDTNAIAQATSKIESATLKLRCIKSPGGGCSSLMAMIIGCTG